MADLTWPEGPVSEWDDLDWLTAEHLHEEHCQRLPHRIMRHLFLPGQWSWNRAIRAVARWLEGGFDPTASDEPGGAPDVR